MTNQPNNILIRDQNPIIRYNAQMLRCSTPILILQYHLFGAEYPNLCSQYHKHVWCGAAQYPLKMVVRIRQNLIRKKTIGINGYRVLQYEPVLTKT